jgi:hypothetical protein
MEFGTHCLTHQSRRAIEQLVAKLDEVLRSQTRIADAALRDSCVY